MLDNIRIILLHTSHSGNVGSVARAMKVMGLNRLYLVDPLCNHLDGRAKALACGAIDLLEQTTVCETFDEALQDVQLLYGTSARSRAFKRSVFTLRNAAPKIITQAANTEIAVVFGSEKSGMSNEELDRCHHHIQVPTIEEYSSLNLSQAVQIVSYELRMVFLEMHKPATFKEQEEREELVSAEKLDKLYLHIESIMKKTGFYKPDHPRTMETRLRQMFNRAQLDNQDMNLLRGILTSVDFKL